MLKNYFKIAWRNFQRNRFYTFINLTGLTIALSVFIVIGLYITNETSFDKSFSDSDRIYRITQQRADDIINSMASVPPGVGNSVAGRFPEVDVVTEVGIPSRRLFTSEQNPFHINKLVSADQNFLSVFDFEVLRGDPQQALSEPRNLILTKSEAEKIFGDEDPIGKVLNYENAYDVKVAAIIQNPPANTHLSFDALLSLSQAQINNRSTDIRWQFFGGGYVYLKLNEGASSNALQAKLREFEKNSNKPEWMQETSELTLQAVTDIHLGPALGNDISPQGDKTNLYLFGGIGILILLLACINYMNLSSAQAMERYKEVGVRKTFGAEKMQLRLQFLMESVLISAITLPFAFVLVELALPYINNALDLSISLFEPQYRPFLLIVPLIILITGFLSGSYSAFFLSSLKPGKVLKSNSGSSGGIFIRRSLLTFQFTASLMLLICTITIFTQLDYISQKNLGFDKEQVIFFSTAHLGDEYNTFKQNLATESSITQVTSGLPAGTGYSSYMKVDKDEETGEETRISFISTDYDYAETLGLKLLSGRYFSEEYASDQDNAVILNEEAALVFNINTSGSIVNIFGEEKLVVGIVKNYHNSSLMSKITPLALALSPGNNTFGMIRLSAGNIQQGIEAAEATWAALVPGRPFEFTFLDEFIERQYQKDQKLANLFTAFAGIAMLVACLGLLGLAAFSTKRRVKEIGIRKVLGASALDIVQLLTREFLVLVSIGLLFAIPAGWYGISKWLSGFEYRIDIGLWIFVLAALPIVLVTVLTVGSQSMKAALMNPINSLRNE